MDKLEEQQNQIGLNKWFILITGIIVVVVILSLSSFRGKIATDLNNISIPPQSNDVQIQTGVGLSGGTITNTGTISLNAPICNQTNDKLQWNGTSFICVDEITGSTSTTTTTGTDNQTLFYSGGNLTISNGNTVTIPIGGTSGITSITAGAGLSGGVITTTGTIALNAPACAFGETLTWNGSVLSCISTAGGGTLDDAYDFGGPGVGRTIFADAGAVSIITQGTIFPTVANDFEILGDGTTTTAGSGIGFTNLTFPGGEAYIQVFGPDASTYTSGSQGSLIYQHDPINPLNDVFVIGIADSPFNNVSALEFSDSGETNLSSGGPLGLSTNNNFSLQAIEQVYIYGGSTNTDPGNSPIRLIGASTSGYDILDLCAPSVPVYGCIKFTAGGELDPNGFVDGYAGSLYVASQTGVTGANVLWANIGTAGVNNNQWVPIGDVGGGGGTLDDAYDFGGPGAGRIINLDQGAVELRTSPSANVPLNERIAFKVVGDGSAPGFSQTAGVGIVRNINPAFPGAEATAFLFSNDIDNFTTTPGYGFLQYADAGGGNNIMVVGAGSSTTDIYGTLFVSASGIVVNGGEALVGSNGSGRSAALGSGNGDGSGDGGSVSIYTGANGVSGNQTGDIFMSTGSANGLSNGNSGQISISTGSSAGTGSSGTVNISTGFADMLSGSVNIYSSNAGNALGTAGNVNLTAGASYSGGNININGGQSSNPFATNGNVWLSAGINTSSTIGSASIQLFGSTQNSGGDVSINSSFSAGGLSSASIQLGGTDTSVSQAATVNINGGNNNTFTPGGGGNVNINGGSATVGLAGSVNISTGSSFSGTPGDLNMATGSAAVANGSGNINMYTGNGNTGSGTITIATGTANSVGNAGGININTGNGGIAGAGAGGDITLNTGGGSVGSSDSAGRFTYNGGSADVTGTGGGAFFNLGASVNGTAGEFFVQGGSASGTGIGGGITLQAGAGSASQGGNISIAAGGSAASIGGAVVITSGDGSIVDGDVFFQIAGTNVIRIHQSRNIDLTGMVSSVNPSTQYLCLDASGRMIAQAGVCNVSSGKYKSDVQDLEIGLEELMNLRPVSFIFDPTGTPSLGFIAEEVAVVDSRLAFSRNGEIEGVNYELISALLTNSIQEQQKVISDIETKLEELGSLPENDNEVNVSGINQNLADLTSQLNDFKLSYEEFKSQILSNIEYPGLEEIELESENIETEIAETSEFLSASFAGVVNFKDQVTFSANNIGKVKILGGTSEIAVTFSKPLTSAPIVTATLASNTSVGEYFIDEVTAFGFKIKLFSAAVTDIDFNWMAFATL